MTTPAPQTKHELSQVDFATFSIDPALFRRVFENLVANAIKNNDKLTPTSRLRESGPQDGER